MERKNIKYLIINILIIVIISIIALSYAYLLGKLESEVNSDVKVALGEQAELIFSKGDDINIKAGAYNMQENGKNLYSSSTVSVTLSSYGNYTANYYVYFDINNNDFEYTTEEKIPELILKIYKNKEEILYIDNLEPTTSGGVTGFDVTQINEVLEIGIPETISLVDNDKNKSSITDEWEFVLYFINLETNQYINSGKTFESNIIIDVEEYERTLLLSDVILLNDNNYSSVKSAKNEIESKNYEWGVGYINDEGLYASIDQTGNNSYFFVGAVEDNYVYFAGYYWRIIRIDGDGNIKLIYAGTSSASTGSNTQITTSYYNTNKNIGYIYESDGELIDSDIKQEIDSWYNENLTNRYSDYIAETLYCIDRDTYTRTGSSSNYVYEKIEDSTTLYTYYYGANKRFNEEFYPSIMCNESQADNIKLNVGLISADEAAFASGRISSNSQYYLYTTSSYYTMTPNYIASNYYYMYMVYGNNSSVQGSISLVGSSGTKYGVRPTISLKNTIII